MATKNDAIAVAQTTALEVRPAYLSNNDVRGTEDIGRDDIQMPRLGLAQKMSPEIDAENAKHIEGLKPGEMFNSLTQQIIGKGPILFTVVRRDPARYVEFIPREQGGGIRDLNVPPDDPRTQFGPNGELPVATKFYDYILGRVDQPGFELIALSLKSTGLKVGRNLNALIKLRNAPLFAGVYSLSVVSEENSKGKYYNFSVKNAGWLNEDMFKIAEQAFNALRNREITIDREGHADDDTSFDTSKM